MGACWDTWHPKPEVVAVVCVCGGQLRARRREVEVLMARCFSRSRRVTAAEPLRTLAAVWAAAEGANMDGLRCDLDSSDSSA